MKVPGADLISLATQAASQELAGRRASISTNIRMLTATGLVEKVAFLDRRHTYYGMAADVWGKAIVSGREKVLAFKSIAELGLAALPEKNEARSRLEEMIEWSNLMAGVYEKILAEWQERRPERSLDTSPTLSTGTVIASFTIGSNRLGFASRNTFANACRPAIRNAVSFESTG
jgi:hypothetical protein